MESTGQSQIKVVVVGHVDHGKSTMLGRILLDCDRVADDKLEKLQRICQEKHIGFEPAFLFDSFAEEHEQGVTIDSTRVEFELEGHRFILIDAPGHSEFLKNFLSASSHADYGFLLLDASEGMREQTECHARLIKLMGVNQVVVVINKMDLVNFDEASFRVLRDEIWGFLSRTGVNALSVIPAVALFGEGVTKPTSSMPWYQGPTVMQALIQLANNAAARQQKSGVGSLRMTLQDVYRFGAERLFVGRLTRGCLRRGERVLFSPSNKAATVKAIRTYDNQSMELCTSGESVALVLEEPLYVERGELITRPDEAPQVSDRIKVTLAWISSETLSPKQDYLLRVGTLETGCRVNLNNALYDEVPLRNGVIEEATLICEKAVPFDAHVDGSNSTNFVLCDETGTVAAGFINGVGMRQETSRVITQPESGYVSREEIEAKQGHGALVLWLTGLPASGKSTIARAVQRKLFSRDVRAVVLDGDNIRGGISQDLGFSAADRSENVRRIAHIAKLFLDCGNVVLVACVSPYIDDRERAREIIGSARFREIYISCPLEVCQERDPKGFYKRNISRELKGLTGYDDPYQPPISPDLTLDTAQLALEDEIEKLMAVVDRSMTFNFAPIPEACGVASNARESASSVFSE